AAASRAAGATARREPNRHAARALGSGARRSSRSRHGGERSAQSRCPATASDVVVEPECRIALAVLKPVPAYLDKQKQVRRPFQHVLQLDPGPGPDRFDPLPALAKHDRALARPLDKDCLL